MPTTSVGMAPSSDNLPEKPMVAALLDTTAATVRPNVPSWRRLPPDMRVLYVCSREKAGDWLAEALAADSASNVVLEEAVGTAAGLARLRDDAFDAVLVSHEPGELDALDLVEGYRAGGAEEPIIVLGVEAEQAMAALCYEVGADGYVSIGATTRNLIWTIARAVERHQLVRENQRLSLLEQTRRKRDHEEAACLLEQQRALLGEIKGISPIIQGDPTDASHQLDLSPLFLHYRELLRTYVIMGSGNLADELRRLAELLVTAGLTARQTLQLHLDVLEELVHGLGSRSARHVMTRADLLALELLLRLADGYRTKGLMIDDC
jgi:DNA-binding NarL/FixJ family response regulator